MHHLSGGLFCRALRVSSFRSVLDCPYVAVCCKHAARLRCMSSNNQPTSVESDQEQEMLRKVKERVGPLSVAPMLPETKNLVVVISGPSGVGKDSVIHRLQQKRPDLYFVVTATTRPMRPGEVDGVDYNFVSREKFEKWIEDGELLEHAIVYEEYKGIPKQQVDNALAKGTDVVLRLDVQGAATVRKLLPEAISIFVTASSETELVERLVSRKTEPLDKMVVRVQTARQEANRITEFDYGVVNRSGHLDDAVEQLSAIIDVEKLRIARCYGDQNT